MLASKYGINCRMTDMKKVTAFLPAQLLANCQDFTGAGVTETLRQALEEMARRRAYEGLKSLRGKVHFDPAETDEFRKDREFDGQGRRID